MTNAVANEQRRFLVGRSGREIVIREVEPGTNAYEFTRAEAFDHAMRLARKSRQHSERVMSFLGLDGEVRRLGTPSEQQRYRATLPPEHRSAPATGLRPSTTPVRPVGQPSSDLALVVADLRETNLQGRLNEFGMSLLEQYERTGRLSERQVAAGMRGIQARQASAPREEAVPEGAHEPTELEQVVADLRESREAGRLSEWGRSVLEQYERNGRLSEKQIAAGMKGIRAKQARAGEQQTQEPLPEVPSGRYAVESAEGELRFYRVSKSQSGRTFIKVQHGPDESEVPFSWEGYRTILQSIVDAGPAAAAIRYGREIGSCSRCGMRLTNRLSRELGIGPICGGHWHERDDWTEKKAAAREAIRARGEDPNEEVAT